MKLLFICCAIIAFVAPASLLPLQIKRATVDAATIQSLAPPLGFRSGINPTGTGDCDGAVNGTDGKPIKIPCACPPDNATYFQQLMANVAAGHAVNNPTVQITFPTDNSTQSRAARLNAASVTLQNLNGIGKGCPVASTTFGAQLKALNGGNGTVTAGG